MANLNLFSDLSGISQSVQEDAIFVIRETYVMPDLVQVFNDLSSSNPRIGYTYNQGTAGTIAEADDLTSHSFVPSADQTLTPIEIGLQFFISDQRADSSGNVPENVLIDAAQELGYSSRQGGEPATVEAPVGKEVAAGWVIFDLQAIFLD